MIEGSGPFFDSLLLFSTHGSAYTTIKLKKRSSCSESGGGELKIAENIFSTTRESFY